MLRRTLAVVFAASCLFPRTAGAEWIVSPYVGARFAAWSTFSFTRTEENKVTFGSSVGFLTPGVLGVEADVAFVPGFFEGEVVASSMVTTVMGNVIIATPLGVSQYGLRPYLTGGAGLIRARGDGDELVGPVITSNLIGMNVGGGAIGPLTSRSSLRFDLRYFRNLSGDPEAILMQGEGLDLSFWRVTVGLTFRF